MSEVVLGNSRLRLVVADITTIEADAIVNAANSSLAGGGGVDGAIHRAAGPQIMAECRKIGRCETGSAVITSAGNLKARYIIHAVAPRYRGRARDADLLASAYATSLSLAEAAQAKSVALPSLGTGAYAYPIEQASTIALTTVANHLRAGSTIELVTFALFSPRDLTAYQAALDSLV